MAAPSRPVDYQADYQPGRSGQRDTMGVEVDLYPHPVILALDDLGTKRCLVAIAHGQMIARLREGTGNPKVCCGACQEFCVRRLVECV